MIEDLTKDAEVGQIYTGKVVKILDFGAFVEILPGKDGMVHISELANYRVPSVEDVVSLGDEITVIVKAVDPGGRISLSRKALLTEEDNSSEGQSQENRDGNDEGFSEPDRSRDRRDQGYNRSRGRNPRGGNRGQSRRRHD